MLIRNGEQDLRFTQMAFETLLSYINRMAVFFSRTVDIVSMKKVGADMPCLNILTNYVLF